ncbi:MAG TPA: GNAT family N-acetyltransferase [Desulfobacteraceae bacterium]|nr:GNAT family N-acetyltransferase [Desulfobacteraceae bacterium]
MALFGQTMRELAERFSKCEEWVELSRDLREPIERWEPRVEGSLRWAEGGDLMMINALEGFVKETDFMEKALDKGDRCLIFEINERIGGFAWVTFRDFKLAPWYTLELSPDRAYLEYIYVRPEFTRKHIGCHLLERLMFSLRDDGKVLLISGVFSDWEVSFNLHKKMGFKVRRRLKQCRMLNIFPLPPADF